MYRQRKFLDGQEKMAKSSASEVEVLTKSDETPTSSETGNFTADESTNSKSLESERLASSSSATTPPPPSSPPNVEIVSSSLGGAREKPAISNETLPIPTEPLASPINILSQIFPARSKSYLETTIKDCNGDLVKALERCAKNNRSEIFRPHMAALKDFNGNHGLSGRSFSSNSPSLLGSNFHQHANTSKLLSPFGSHHKSAFLPASHPYNLIRSSSHSMAPFASSFHQQSATSSAHTSSSESGFSPTLFPFPPPFFPSMYLNPAAMTLSNFNQRSLLSLGSNNHSSLAHHQHCSESDCAQCQPRVDSTDQNISVDGEDWCIEIYKL